MSLLSQSTHSTTLNTQNVPRRQNKARDGTRERSIRSIIASDSSNSKIIYMYCSPKLKNALTCLLRFIIVAYCITVPLFVYLLHKESNDNLDSLDRLERHLENGNVRDNINKRKRRSYLSTAGNKSLQIGQQYFLRNYKSLPKLQHNVKKDIAKLNKTVANYGNMMKRLGSVELWIYEIYTKYVLPNITNISKKNCSRGERNRPSIQALNLWTTYIHWGSSSCKLSNTKVIYTGFMSGALPRPGHSSMKQGGGVNYLCLPSQPKYGNYAPGRSERRTYIDGVIYGESFQNLANKVITCTVCEAYGKTETIMIPGMNVCEKGWSVEYTGFIATDGKENQRSEYVCLDRNINNTNVASHMRIYVGSLDTVSVKCMEGMLPCGESNRYKKHSALPCVVCSR